MRKNELMATALTSGSGLPLRDIALVAGCVLLLAGVYVIGRGFRRGPSGSAFAEALAAATSSPIPVALGDGPNPPWTEGRRPERSLAALLADPSAWPAVDAAVESVLAALAGPNSPAVWPYAALLTRETITVLLAGAPPLPEPPAPWRDADGTGRWTADRASLAYSPQAASRPGAGTLRHAGTFVALGSRDGAAVLLDLARAPAIVTVTGDRAASRRLVRALAVQLSAAGHRVLFTAGVTDDGRGGAGLPGPLTGLLDHIGDGADRAGSGQRRVVGGPWTFLVCGEPAPQEAERLRGLIAADERLRVIVLGEVTDWHWSLQVDAAGVVIGDGLALAAATRSLPDRPAGRAAGPEAADPPPPAGPGWTPPAGPAWTPPAGPPGTSAGEPDELPRRRPAPLGDTEPVTIAHTQAVTIARTEPVPFDTQPVTRPPREPARRAGRAIDPALEPVPERGPDLGLDPPTVPPLPYPDGPDAAPATEPGLGASQ